MGEAVFSFDVEDAAGNEVPVTLDLTFAGNATSGQVIAISGSVGSNQITGLDSSFEGADNVFSPTNPYVDNDGISFDTQGDQFNLYYTNVGDALIGRTLGGSRQITDESVVLCFLAGTLIGTPEGQIEVERLAVGDRVLTASGAVRPVVWVGHGRVLATRGRRGPATPVIVRKGALGPNVPHQDLRVTKGHAFWFDGVLIPVEFLVNHRSILWDDRAQEVSLYHVELDAHDVLLANGAAAESYRDDGNRWLFQNANAGWDLPAKVPCAPVLTGGPVVDEVWRRLLQACGPRPSVPLTPDADVHLLVDGVRVDGVRTGGVPGDVFVFAVDARASAVHLGSRSAVPQELGVARDPRCLGVAVRRVVVRQGTRFRVVSADDARLADGLHAFETDTGVRWTDGDATLPAVLFDGFSGSCEVVVHLGGTARYTDDGAAEQVA